MFVCSPSAGLNSKSIASSDPSSLLSLMLSTSHQKSSMEVLSMEACELERLNAGGADSLESILLILRQRERDFLKRESDTNKIIFLTIILLFSYSKIICANLCHAKMEQAARD